LELIPGEGTEGRNTQWVDGTTFSLGAPILDFRLDQLNSDDEFRGQAAGILKFWIDVDEENLKSVRMHVRAFKMPDRYQTNILSPTGSVIVGLTKVDSIDLDRAVSQLIVPLDNVTDQLFKHGDLLGAVRGMLLLRQLYWGDRFQPSALSHHLPALNNLLLKAPSEFFFTAIDELGNGLDVQVLGCVADGKLLDRVDRIFLTGRKVTDSIVRPLKGACHLKWLHLRNTRISDEGVKFLKDLVELRELLLGGTAITDAGLKYLRRMEQLAILDLSRTRITSEGLKHLKRLPRLENLYLNGTKVGDEGLRHIGRLPCLEVLVLDGTRATDKGLIHLRGARRLRKLYRYRTKITDGAAAELQKTLRELIVIPNPVLPDARS